MTSVDAKLPPVSAERWCTVTFDKSEIAMKETDTDRTKQQVSDKPALHPDEKVTEAPENSSQRKASSAEAPPDADDYDLFDNVPL